ncbi:abortive infection system antitoxin AbiGi family protein [Shewanella oncorhynchi]|uniref:abortive infection system antitoxin AbiGi family protein n=1 Tax=Shewanella oncorhynchi TaxID=2726434 RepID=UPI0039EE4107
MNKALSAKSLFHFTPELEYLKSILSNGVSPRYCIEDISSFSPLPGLDEVAQPMACFCDITLSSIHHHISKYGYYGVGLSKDWGMKNNITPVKYLHKNSITGKLYRQSFNMAKKFNMPDEAYDFILGPMLALGNFFKSIEGKMFKDGKWSDETYNFYDEREWRYIPVNQIESAMEEGHMVRTFLKKDEFMIGSVKEYHNLQTAKYCSLKFEASDIKYIFVKSESQIDEMVAFLAEVFNLGKEGLSINHFYGKLVSIENLLEDM